MGLYVTCLDTVSIKDERSLYIYLLDYGWPEGRWEKIFKKHFMKMADMAAETGAVVVGSPRGVHFANDILSWHKVGDLDAETVLPGLLVTKTHPSYFEGLSEIENGELHDMLIVPLRSFCQNEDDFLKAVEEIFSDLREGKELRNFSIATHDFRKSKQKKIGDRLVKSIEAKPGAFGFAIDLKSFFS